MMTRRNLDARWILLLVFLFPLINGGCGGSGGGAVGNGGSGENGKSAAVSLISAKSLGTEADAGGYIDLEVEVFSDEEGETNNLSLLLYGTSKSADEKGEKLLAWGNAGFLEKGTQSYQRRLKVSVSDESGETLASGEYGSLRAVLFAGSTFKRAVGAKEAGVSGAIECHSHTHTHTARRSHNSNEN